MNMAEQEIFEQLVPLVRQVTGAKAEQVTMGASLVGDLGAESIDLLDLSFLIEEISITNACNLNCPLRFTYNRPDRI